ncbi:adipokinetic hormone [Episyrphus balteatus]|uniref:adipokinetic hormone n=1 Tax=Episyrphus balteatus TaxID=286459 RepID=UPI0024868185|nr:adipokinetic hormone [Episyrphus balteatus]
MSSIRSVLISAVILVVIAMCNCQLTFSPGWGKRSSSAGIFEPHPGNCHNANEMLMDIFKFVQNEAQMYLDCNQQK